MKRLAIKEYGPAKAVFEAIEAQPRAVGPAHIRVSLEAFALNPYDVSVRSGRMKEVQSVKFPYVLGHDGTGIVTEVGAEVTELKVGDAVIVYPISGTYGEEVVLPAKKAVKRPSNMSIAEAAALPTMGITAYNILHQLLKIKKGLVVMVQGASGGVGSLLIQLLKANGNHVLASASAKNEDFVKGLGADEFVAYDQADAGAVFANRATIVIDATKGSLSAASGMQILKENGTYIALNNLPKEAERTKSGTYIAFQPKREYPDKEALEALVSLYERDQLSIHVAEVWPFTLANVIKGHELLEGHPPAGKIVIQIKE
ncbi:alcohol dehydrogenase [Enterococcus sp. JM4C]|uniref:NADP-dependent oxidoreductase n=1 Tax=Candidatus Enterococcus huntleyi TaxID=1857217 RepID=UPI0013795A53|nr:NADP-dependent oxidoreductase [Enterococcus sp. JM4C]KAF1299518.1 alcohol dehydrogenase [Enterococcus sp. JM4C]